MADPSDSDATAVTVVAVAVPEPAKLAAADKSEQQQHDTLAQESRPAEESHAEVDVEKEEAGGSETVADEKGGGSGGSGALPAEEDDPNLVGWDGPDDPANPLNWSTWLKVMNCALVAALTFVTPLGSSIFAPGVPQLMVEFQSDNIELAAFVVSVYVLGFAFGPLFLAPLSEIYGRLVVYHCCNACFFASLIACAVAPSLNSLIGFRFLAGIFGSAPLTNGGGTIADMFRQEHRGGAMAAFSLGPLLGPIVGPIAGGFLAGATSWRWVFWLMAILEGTLSLAMLVFARETYAPIILQRKVRRLRKQTGNQQLRSKLDSGLSPGDYFQRSIVRPVKMLVYSPMCLILAVYISIMYGYLYIMFTSITEVFEEYYGFSTSTVGLVFIGLGVGCLIGLAYVSYTSDRMIKKMAAQEGGVMKPEHRMRPLPIAAILLPAGLFLYGWSAEYRVHWIVPILGHLIIGIANIIIFFAVSMALIDIFTVYAASALAGNTLLRSIVGAVLPLCGLQMYEALGLGWGNSLLAFIAIGMLPVALLILRYGEWLRMRFPVEEIL